MHNTQLAETSLIAPKIPIEGEYRAIIEWQDYEKSRKSLLSNPSDPDSWHARAGVSFLRLRDFSTGRLKVMLNFIRQFRDFDPRPGEPLHMTAELGQQPRRVQ